MREMLAQFWTMLTTFFRAGERLAISVDNVAKVCETTTASWADEAQIERDLRLMTINQRMVEVKQLQSLPAPQP